jgi:hypothetical protein
VPAPETLLRIYLNDHYAGSTLGLSLARRVLRNNPDGELGRFLAGLVVEIAEDRATLERLMDALGAPRNHVKVAAARAAEAVGRLKLNGRLRGYSDLSRVLELEGLRMGIDGKAAMWAGLKATGRSLPVDLDELLGRAGRQQEGVERHRLAATRRAFGTSG